MTGEDDQRWMLTRAARDLWAKFRADWSAVPPRAKWRWVMTLGTGFVVSAAFMAAMTVVARGNEERERGHH